MAASKTTKDKVKKKYKGGARIASYGIGGTIAGTVVGSMYGHTKTGSRVGTAVGLGVGGWRTSKWAAKQQVPSTKPSTGTKEFKKRVGTKTNGRVGKKDNPYT